MRLAESDCVLKGCGCSEMLLERSGGSMAGFRGKIGSELRACVVGQRGTGQDTRLMEHCGRRRCCQLCV